MRNLFLPGRSTVHSLNGMAATSQPMSSMTAISILQAGGNAMDAAIAAVAVQCVVEPQSTGIGGDCFCMYSPKGEGVVALNGSGRAPAASSAEWFLENGIDKIPKQSPHSVTIPGAVDAWARLITDHGSMSLGDVLQPAIGFARDGFAVNQRSALDFFFNEELLAADPTAAEYYLRDGKGPKIGSVVKLPLLAKTLETIAEKGRDGFYTGAVAEDIVGFLRDKGGLHTMADFESNHPDYVTPISTNYRGYDVFECPPNGQGVVALAMLNILSGFDLGAMDPLSVDRLHLEIEAARLAYRDRSAVLADPSFVDVPVEKWLSEDYAAQNRATISMDKRQDPLPPSSLPPHNDTVYVTVVDKDRNAVSIINTLYDNFGSGQVAPKSGVVLQNRGQGFVVEPGHPNCIAGGKRPLHTIIPGMLMKDGKAQMPFGVMGGEYQACGHAHVLSNILDFNMDLQEALDMTRVFPAIFDPAQRVQVEEGLPDDIHDGLKKRGHETFTPPRPIGGAQAIWIDHDQGVLAGASEPRKDGQAIGY